MPHVVLIYLSLIRLIVLFFFNDTATTEIYTLSLTTLFRSRALSSSSWTWCSAANPWVSTSRSEEHTSELQSHHDLVCRLLLEKKKKTRYGTISAISILHTSR